MPADSAQLSAQIKQHFDHLAASLETGHSEALLAYLRFAARFPHYSARNIALIEQQAPAARFVASFGFWRALGRPVLKGSKAHVWICAYRPKKTGEDARREDGAPAADGGFFGYVPVFTDAQTDEGGAPLPGLNLTAEHDGAPAILARLLAACPVPVSFAKLGGPRGRTDGARIQIDPDACGSVAQQCLTVLHEWAHVALHFGSERVATPEGRADRELEADACAYVMGGVLGIDATAKVKDYIEIWGGNAVKLRAALDRIMGTVKGMVQALEMDSAVAQAAD